VDTCPVGVGIIPQAKLLAPDDDRIADYRREPLGDRLLAGWERSIITRSCAGISRV
jgi:hypothetical protein